MTKIISEIYSKKVIMCINPYLIVTNELLVYKNLGYATIEDIANDLYRKKSTQQSMFL